MRKIAQYISTGQNKIACFAKSVKAINDRTEGHGLIRHTSSTGFNVFADKRMVALKCMIFTVVLACVVILDVASAGAAGGPLRGLAGKCLDVWESNPTDGTRIVLWPCHGGANQQWELRSDGTIQGLAGKCLDVWESNPTDGTRIVLWPCHGGANQQWSVSSPPASAMPSTDVITAMESCKPSALGFDVPSTLRDCGTPHCGRLKRELRQAAQTKNARDILLRSARVYFGKGGQSLAPRQRELAQAFADLAVTGRHAYQSFIDFQPSKPSSITWLEDGLRELLENELHPGHAVENPAPFGPPKPQDIQWSVRQAVQRAYQVAWAIRGPVQYREHHRASLGWIATSGEDDPPHRPVNVPSAPYPQYNMVVNVKGSSKVLPVTTRYIVASESIQDTQSEDLSNVPLDSVPPKIDGDIILFIHGHSSHSEEGVDLAKYLLRESKKDNRPLTVIAMDLPSSGYASRIEHTSVAPSDQSKWNKGYPVLQFIEEFIIDFVAGLEAQQPGVQNQIVAVIGGSLGGNMTLRLAERNPSWLRNAVSWSAVSTYQSWARATANPVEAQHWGRFFDVAKALAVGGSFKRGNESEEPESRFKHFYDIGGKFDPGHVLPNIIQFFDKKFLSAQADHWYSRKWDQKCREAAVKASIQYSEEVYDSLHRRWHWRLAHEQLIFSHLDSDDPNTGDPEIIGTQRYKKIATRLLLAAGKDDDNKPEVLFHSISKLSQRMTMTQGKALFFANTGHSIHTERPSNFAWEIMNFLYQRPTPAKNDNSGKPAATPKPLCTSGKCCEKSDDGKKCKRCIPEKDRCFID